jgi:MFS family permease
MPAEAAMIADISVPSTRGRMYGIVGAAHPIGSIVAPLVGGFILDNFGWNAVFYSIVFFALMALIPSLLLSETKKKKTEKGERIEGEDPTRKNFKGRIDVNFLYPMLIFSAYYFFNGIGMGLSQITPIYLKERFNATSFQQGLFFSVGTMIPWLMIEPIGGWLADRYSRRKIILASIVLWPFLTVLWPNMSSYTSLLLLKALTTSTRFSMPASQAYRMDFTSETRRGLAVGFTNIGQRLGGTVIGAPLLGYLYEQYGLEIPFYVAAVFPLPAIPILMLIKEKWKQK